MRGSFETDEQFAEWGRRESRLRQFDLSGIQSEAELKAAQSACERRRKAVGLTAGQAAFAVTVGQRLERGESLPFAMRQR